MSDLFDPPPPTKHTILSLGAGVQSTAMALMAAKGLITPMPDLAIFADTQAEPQFVYDHLEWLIKELPYPVEIVTAGSLTEKSLQERKRIKDGVYYMPKEIPLFGILPSGKITGALGRQCTNDFKIQPILKYTKKKFNIKRGEKDPMVTEWIGISWDEVQRMKFSRVPWTIKRYPLIEKRLRRTQCSEWLTDNGYEIPIRSACYYCPFHDNDDWRHLKKYHPEEFQKAVDFDKQIREKFYKYDKMKMPVFLHKSCKPLDEVDFDSDEDKGQQVFDFTSECEGMCGI